MRYIRYFIYTSFPVIIFFFIISCFLPPISGDLTRLGNFSEADFGCNEPFPEMIVKSDIGTSNPNIIVLGDSFSERNIWQSVVMAKRGDKILTFNWVDPKSLDRWVSSLKKRYPTVKYLIIETVERSSLSRFNQPQDLFFDHKESPLKNNSYKTDSLRDTSFFHAMHDPVYALFALFNSYNLINNNFKILKSGPVIVAPLTTSKLFSSKRSDLLIYYQDDDLKKSWTSDQITNAVDHLGRLNELSRQNGIRLIVIVVPDKSTAYRKYFKYSQYNNQSSDFWKEIDKQKLCQVNLGRVINNNVEKTRDLYLPDDTHFSTKGFVLMGLAVSKYVDDIEKSQFDMH